MSDFDLFARALDRGENGAYPTILTPEEGPPLVGLVTRDGELRSDTYPLSQFVGHPIPNEAGGYRSMSRVAVKTDCSTGTCYEVLYSEGDRAAYSALAAKHPGWAPLPLFMGYDLLIDSSKIRQDVEFGQLTPIGNIKPGRDGFLDRMMLPLLMAGFAMIAPGFGIQQMFAETVNTTSFLQPLRDAVSSVVSTVNDFIAPAVDVAPIAESVVEFAPVAESVVEFAPVAESVVEFAADTIPETLLAPLDSGAGFMSTIETVSVPEVPTVDDYDFSGDAWTDGWDSYEWGDADFVDSPVTVEPEFTVTESIIDKPQATMPDPGAPAQVFRPEQSGMPGASASVSIDRILSSGASLLRQILNPSTSGTRTDPRTGRPIPVGAAIDPKTGLPVLDARGNFVRAGSIGAGGNQTMILAALGIGAFILLRKRRA